MILRPKLSNTIMIPLEPKAHPRYGNIIYCIVSYNYIYSSRRRVKSKNPPLADGSSAKGCRGSFTLPEKQENEVLALEDREGEKLASLEQSA